MLRKYPDALPYARIVADLYAPVKAVEHAVWMPKQEYKTAFGEVADGEAAAMPNGMLNTAASDKLLRMANAGKRPFGRSWNG
jgi:hypothetical protein